MSEWIEFMAFTKYKVNKNTGQHEHLGGWTKEVGVWKPKSAKKSVAQIETKMIVDEDEYL